MCPKNARTSSAGSYWRRDNPQTRSWPPFKIQNPSIWRGQRGYSHRDLRSLWSLRGSWSVRRILLIANVESLTAQLKKPDPRAIERPSNTTSRSFGARGALLVEQIREPSLRRKAPAPVSMEAFDRETECVNAESKGAKAESYYSRLEEEFGQERRLREIEQRRK